MSKGLDRRPLTRTTERMSVYKAAIQPRKTGPKPAASRTTSKDPNKNWGEQNLQEWPVHTAAQKEYLYLNADNVHNLLTGKGLRAKECAFWKEYLPRLVAATLDISEAEKQWKVQFAEYSQKYIVDWKHQFENFVKNHEKRMANCKNDS
eukprot:XP_014774793.1 PREDICTED: acetylcholinesterase-like [Octopus bimaculoides]